MQESRGPRLHQDELGHGRTSLQRAGYALGPNQPRAEGMDDPRDQERRVADHPPTAAGAGNPRGTQGRPRRRRQPFRIPQHWGPRPSGRTQASMGNHPKKSGHQGRAAS